MQKVFSNKIFWTIILGFLGFYLNHYSYDLAYGISFSFGGIFVALAILTLSPIHGSITALIAASSTLALYHHPYAVFIWTAEAYLAAKFYQRTKNKSLLMTDAAYWLGVGFPLVFLFYYFILKNSLSDTLLIAVKQSLNGIMNVLLAEIGFYSIIHFFPINNFFKNQKIKTREVIFHMTIGFLIIPTFLFTLFVSRVEVAQSEKNIETKINDKFQQMNLLLEDWLEEQKVGITQVVKTGSEFPIKPNSKIQSELKTIKELFPYFHNVYLADKSATTYAFYPQFNDVGLNSIGVNFSDRNYFKEVQKTKEIVVSEVFMGRVATYPMITISQAMYDKEKFVGFGLGAINLKKLAQKIDEINKDSNLTYSMLDKNGKIFATNNSKHEIMSVLDFKSDKFIRLKNTNLKVRTPPSDNLSALIADWKRSFYYSENNLTYVPWKIVIEAPVKDIQMATFTKLRFVLTFALVFIYIAILISMFISHKLTYTVTKIAALANNSAGVSDKIDWPDSNIEEMSILLNSLKDYKTKVDNHIELVHDLNKSLEEKVQTRTQELSESEKRYRTFFEENFAPMIMVDCSSRMVLDANQAAIVFYGWTIEEMRAKHIDEINCTPNIEKTVVSHLNEVKSRKKQVFQFLHRTAKNGIRDVEVYATKIDVNNREIIFSIIHDITERITAEKLVENQREKLAIAERMAHLGEMAGGISHAVNNPLAVIAGKAKQVKRYIDEPLENREKILKAMDLILTMTNRIANIENSLKDFAHNADEGSIDVVSIGFLIESALTKCRVIIESKNIRISISEISSELKTECNPELISKALANIISNSCEAIENLEDKWIKIQVQKRETKLSILVIDSGTGISKNVAEKMMVPFFTTKEIGKGAGLGLSMSLGIIEYHKGSIEYNSNAKNTEFIVTLPVSIKKAA